MCPIILSIMSLVTLFYILQDVFSSYFIAGELPWPSGYELRLSLERSRVLIPVKVIGGRQEGHPVQKMLTAPAKSQLTIGHRPSPVKTGSV